MPAMHTFIFSSFFCCLSNCSFFPFPPPSAFDFFSYLFTYLFIFLACPKSRLHFYLRSCAVALLAFSLLLAFGVFIFIINHHHFVVLCVRRGMGKKLYKFIFIFNKYRIGYRYISGSDNAVVVQFSAAIAKIKYG